MDGEESIASTLSDQSVKLQRHAQRERARPNKEKTFAQRERELERSLSKEDRLRRRAAKLIQCAYRRRLARRAAQDRFLAQYRREYDSETRRFVYVCKRVREGETHTVLRRLPRFFPRGAAQEYTNALTQHAGRECEAPREYSAGEELTGEGYALVVTCTEFKLGKWPELSDAQTQALLCDHENVVNTLSHPFFGKLRPENVLSLRNPLVQEVREALVRLRRTVRASGFVSLYLATHLTTVFRSQRESENNKDNDENDDNDNNEKEDGKENKNNKNNKNKSNNNGNNKNKKPKAKAKAKKTVYSTRDAKENRAREREFLRERKRENAYFAFRDTLWTNAAEATQSSLSLCELARLWSAIHCKEKAIFLQCALMPAPAVRSIGTSKVVYPPPDALQRLSSLARCAVLSSCATGFLAREYAQRLTPWAASECVSDARDEANKTQSLLFRRRQDVNSTQAHTQAHKISPEAAQSAESGREENAFSLYRSALWAKLLREWEISPQKEIVRAPPPEPPQPQWSKPEDREFQLTIELPSDQEVNTYTQRYYLWRIRRALTEPFNLLREGYALYKTVTTRAPKQHALLRDGETLFGRAFVAAVRGGISSSERETCSLSALFSFVRRKLREEVQLVHARKERARPRPVTPAETLNETEIDKGDEENENRPRTGERQREREKEKDSKRGKKKGKDKDRKKEKEREKEREKEKEKELEAQREKANSAESEGPLQTPALFFPLSSSRKEGEKRDPASFDARLFYRCGPPPAPERPFVLRVGAQNVTLEWFDPPFEGAPPTHYRVFMRNVTRNFHTWSEVFYPTEIRSTRFVVRDLPGGIACQFKVQACNAAGWSTFSEETSYVTPGEDQAVLPDSVRWKRLQLSGAWGVLDRLDLFPQHRKEQLTGLKMIHGFALCRHGFDKVKLALRVAQAALRSLEVFLHDAEIIALSLNVIGWCLQGKPERKVRNLLNQRGLSEIVSERVQRYRYHTSVVAAVQWLRTGNMTKHITELPEYKHRQLFPAEEEEQQSSDEDDDEQQQEKDEKEQSQ